MSWNYRIIHHTEEQEPYYALHEVFYNDDSEIEGWTEDPIDFISWEEEGLIGIIEALIMALEDTQNRKSLDYKIDLQPIIDKRKNN